MRIGLHLEWVFPFQFQEQGHLFQNGTHSFVIYSMLDHAKILTDLS
jgi:hypothetical protein